MVKKEQNCILVIECPLEHFEHTASTAMIIPVTSLQKMIKFDFQKNNLTQLPLLKFLGQKILSSKSRLEYVGIFS